LGGSFDPPTISHMQLACEIYNNYADVDEVWFVPCGDGRGDKSLRTAAIHRMHMLELILKDLIDDSVPIKVNFI
jgi:nicotinic acid mononucleotide adenylyltransferase